MNKKYSDDMTAYNNLKHDIQAMIPDDIKEQLNSVTSDSEACRILAENGVDIHALEKKITDAGFQAPNSVWGTIDDGVTAGAENRIDDQALAAAAGGFFPGNTSTDVVCKCGNRKREDFDTLFIAGLTASYFKNYRFVFRCKKCKQLVGVNENGEIVYIQLGNTPLSPGSGNFPSILNRKDHKN